MKVSDLKIGALYSLSKKIIIYNNWWFNTKIQPKEQGKLESDESFVLLKVDAINKHDCCIKILSSQGIIGWIVVSCLSIKPVQKTS